MKNNFLSIDLANLTNQQKTNELDYQGKLQALFNDQAATNAASQFNAKTQNEVDMFFKELGSQVDNANKNRMAAQTQFNTDQANAQSRFVAQLQDSREKFNQNISNDLKDPNGYWVPITYRTRIIVYSKERVSKEELSTYEDLANEKWKGKILVRSSSNAYNQALMSSIIANNGAESASKWSTSIVKNFARNPKGNDRDQVKAIAAGQGDLAIVNSYYIGLLLSSENPEELNAGNSIEVYFPNQGADERGCLLYTSPSPRDKRQSRMPSSA